MGRELFIAWVSNRRRYWADNFAWALGFGLLEFADFEIFREGLLTQEET